MPFLIKKAIAGSSDFYYDTEGYEPAEWLDQIPTAVVAEAITDRLASQAYRIIIRGNKSMRETIRK